jgi:hypothetical protein
LGLGFKSAGFDVVIFTNPDHQDLVETQGLKFISNTLHFKDFFTSKETAEATASNNFLVYLDGLGKLNAKGAAKQYETYYKTIKSFKPELIVAGTQHWPDAVTIPLLLRVPTVAFNLSNSHTVDPYESPAGLPSLPFGLNAPIWRLAYSKWVGGLKDSYGVTLAELSGKPMADFFPTTEEVIALFGGLTPDPFSCVPYMVAQDENFVGKKATDPPRLIYTGNLTLPAAACQGKEFGGEAAVALDGFLDSCPTPPVYVGWGSMTVCTPKWMTLMAVRSLKLVGCRGVILGGWAGMKIECLEGEPDTEQLKAFCKENVFFIETAAHEVLFPKCSVIVHHGGIGTTTAGVKSGRPNVVTPIFYDQFDSATLVNRVNQGVGTAHLPTLRPDDLAGYIRTCLEDPEKIRNAAELGMKMRERDGVKEAVGALVDFMRNTVRSGDYWSAMDTFAESKKKQALGFWGKLWQTCSGEGETPIIETTHAVVKSEQVLLGREQGVMSPAKAGK